MHLALGTVQLGMPYGIANTAGMPDESAAADILRAACESGMRWLDTAAAYGQSESVIGKLLPQAWSGPAPCIATKFVLDEKITPQAQLASALEKLRRDQVEAVLLHQEKDIDHPRFADFAALSARDGVQSVGISCYTPQIAQRGIQAGLRCLQIQSNLFDTTHAGAGVLRLARERGVTVFVRSIFLQGLFFLPPDHERSQRIPGAEMALRALHDFCHRHAITPATLALAYGATLDEAIILLGAENAAQARSSAALAHEAESHRELALRWLRERPSMPDSVIQPAFWPKL